MVVNGRLSNGELHMSALYLCKMENLLYFMKLCRFALLYDGMLGLCSFWMAVQVTTGDR